MTTLKRTNRRDSEASALNDFLVRVGSYTTDLIFAAPEGKGLYHYSDLSGLTGIISNTDLWLTDCRYSNDSEEMNHGYGVARRILAEEVTLASTSGDSDRAAYLDRVAEVIARPPSEAVYIACFCLEGNLLSQWRGYGANGSGVSLEFDPPRFSSITGPDSPSRGLMRLWKVFYDSAIQTSIIREALRFGFERPGSIIERAGYAADAVIFFVPTFKHSDFREEQECRLIFTPPPGCVIGPRFRVTRGMLVPYYSVRELTADSFGLPLRRVVVGPAPHKKLNVASIEALLSAYGYEGIPVDTSDTPFRA